MLVSLGLRTSRCHPRFQPMNRSLPGLMVQRKRVFVPTFCESGLVLNEAAQHEIGAAGVGTLQLPQTLDEVALGRCPKTPLTKGLITYVDRLTGDLKRLKERLDREWSSRT